MTTLTAQGAALRDFPNVTRIAPQPVISEKREPANVRHSGDFAWRAYLSQLGVDAAIITCDLRGPEGGKHIYLVGLDEAKANPQLSEGLIAYAETIWRVFPAGSFRTYSLSSPPQVSEEDRSQLGALTRICGVALTRLLAGFEHAAVMHAASGMDSTAALLLRRRAAGPFCERIERRLLDALPLFHDAALSQARSLRSEQRAALLTAMFDQVSLATLLVNGNGRPLFVNQVAQEMLSSRQLILQSADGTIVCADSNQTKALRTAIRTAATSRRDMGDEISMRIGHADAEWRLAVVVPASTTIGEQQIRCAMVLVHGPRHAEAPSHMLKALGLLPSEQRFLEAFLRTSSLAEAATLSGLSEETARTYLKRIRGKLGVHRQLDLARLIYGLVPPIRIFEQQAAE